MMEINIVPILDSKKTLSKILFVCMSFENIRWKEYLTQKKDNYEKIIVFYNKEFYDLYKDNISNYENGIFELSEISIGEPLVTADNFVQTIDKYQKENIDIDCSTFTHEHLLILFRVFDYIKYKHKINVIYTSVNAYSVGRTNGWLSKGVRDIRNVLGYSGNMIPSKPLHLIILVGLENERIEKIIEEYEPSKITIGKCATGSSFNDNISELNEKYHNNIDDFIKKVTSNVNESQAFEFSCSVPEDTYAKLNEIIFENKKYNNIIVAANSKVSTLGVLKVALLNEDIQLCYAQPSEYNINSYTHGIKEFKYYEVGFNWDD